MRRARASMSAERQEHERTNTYHDRTEHDSADADYLQDPSTLSSRRAQNCLGDNTPINRPNEKDKERNLRHDECADNSGHDTSDSC